MHSVIYPVASRSLGRPEGNLHRLERLGTVLMAADSDMDLSDHQLRTLSPVALAYVGDAVYELFVRGALLVPPKRIRAYHQQVVNQVRAERQSYYLQQLIPLLTEAEQDVLRRGRNAASRGPKRLDGQTYRQATGFEALIGYLYLTDLSRLVDLLGQLDLAEGEDIYPEREVDS